MEHPKELARVFQPIPPNFDPRRPWKVGGIIYCLDADPDSSVLRAYWRDNLSWEAGHFGPAWRPEEVWQQSWVDFVRYVYTYLLPI